MAYEMLDITMRQRPVYVYKGAYFSPMNLIVQGRRRCYNSHDGVLTHDLYVDDCWATNVSRQYRLRTQITLRALLVEPLKFLRHYLFRTHYG